MCRKHTDKSDQVGGSDEVKVSLENLIQFLVDFESNSGKGLREACMQVSNDRKTMIGAC